MILVDLDLRHPGIDAFFSLGGRPGLTSVAAGEIALKDALSIIDVRPEESLAYAGGLEVLTVGSAPPDPGQFLSSQLVSDTLVTLSERCDVLLIDTPPMLAVGDAMTIATQTDAVLLVVDVNEVRRATLTEMRRVLEACPAMTLGLVATGWNGADHRGYRRNGDRRQGVADA